MSDSSKVAKAEAASSAPASTTQPAKKSRLPGTSIAIIVISIIILIFYIIALVLIFTTSGSVPQDKQSGVNAAGALIALSIPFAIVAIILGVLWVGKKGRGEKSRGYGIAFVIFAILSALLLVIGVIVAFTIIGSAGDAKNKLEAGAVFAILGFVGFVVIFFLVVFAKRKNMTSAERQTQGENVIGKENYKSYRQFRGKPYSSSTAVSAAS